jgi:serine/threonine-protein kinase
VSLVGTRLAGFELLEDLGGGSMAGVYKARDATGALVVLKVLHPFLSGNPRVVARFRREGELLEALVHPNIIAFKGRFEAEGRLIYAMEFLHHRTVEDLLKEHHRLPVRVATRVVADVAAALAHAHVRRVIHRDLKPSNIFYVEAPGRAILSDFGLAKPLDEIPITADGARMMGTPHYMAPEQVLGDPTTPRTDIYQLGLVLFELLTGRRPFEGKYMFKTIMARCEADVAFLPEEEAFLPLPVRQVVLRSTRRRPEERYSDAHELSDAVAEAGEL